MRFVLVCYFVFSYVKGVGFVVGSRSLVECGVIVRVGCSEECVVV
jgi:hypothetical protein